jgi:hypothetical protein
MCFISFFSNFLLLELGRVGRNGANGLVKAKKIQRKINVLEHDRQHPEHTLHHLDTTSSHHPYPAHPGHRKGYSYEQSSHQDDPDNISPVLRRTSVGEEVVPLHGKLRKQKGNGSGKEGVENRRERMREEREYEEEESEKMDREVKDLLEDELRGGEKRERMEVVGK